MMLGFILLIDLMVIAAVAVPAALFLLNLRDLLREVRPENRRMEPGLVWLNLIPWLGVVWMLVTVFLVRASLRAELADRDTSAKERWSFVAGIIAAVAGLAFMCLVVAGVHLFPEDRWILVVLERTTGLTFLVSWVTYWVMTALLKSQLKKNREALKAACGGAAMVGEELATITVSAAGYCSYCGVARRTGDKFCSQCGRPLE